MSKDNLKQAAEKLFAATTHDVLWGNPKGEFFTSENMGKISLEKDQKLTKFERASNTVEAKNNDASNVIKPKTAEYLINEAKELETIEQVELFKEIEAKAKNRTTVIAAYDERIAELTAAIDVTTEGTDTLVPTNGNEDTEGKK